MKIYKIVSPGEECYIGRTYDIRQRRASHRTQNCSSAILFDKYGFDNCSFEILEECYKDIAPQREQWWIDNTPNVVNVARAVKKPKPKKLWISGKFIDSIIDPK